MAATIHDVCGWETERNRVAPSGRAETPAGKAELLRNMAGRFELRSLGYKASIFQLLTS